MKFLGSFFFSILNHFNGYVSCFKKLPPLFSQLLLQTRANAVASQPGPAAVEAAAAADAPGQSRSLAAATCHRP